MQPLHVLSCWMVMMFRQYIQGTNHFPKPDVVYWDFTGLLTDPEARKKAIHEICDHFKNKGLTHIAAIEAKGFILGSLLAHEMNLPLFLVRKPGLIPGSVINHSFDKEYGTGAYEMAKRTLSSDSKVLIVYDILAGPGATLAAAKLIQESGGNVEGCAYVVELSYLSAREKLKGMDVYSLVKINEKERDAIRSH